MGVVKVILTRFKRPKKDFLKVYTYKNDKTLSVKYLHKTRDKNKIDNILINSNHVFYHNGYATILTSDTKAETINPLDLKSAYDKKDFETAINSKLIRDTFNSTKPKPIDKITLLLVANMVGIVTILYYIINMKG